METKDPKVAKEYKTVTNLVGKQIRQMDKDEQKTTAKQAKQNPQKIRSYTPTLRAL